ncbi:hypothetical protein [Streptomyces sp. SID3343]|uniref:hypothetical protein n=1 Tax=Streptomyces sp. SID3343 TaxID=2690260 RepID=UPI001370D384|nr:hypothetical protein [Streptomyces sp. SID3343]MYV98397.1 hypothetical protein [Streptomyces sp. SID3343]
MNPAHLPVQACPNPPRPTSNHPAIPPYARRAVWQQTVRRDPEIERTLLLFALLLSSYANADGTGIRVTHAILAADGGFHLSTVRRALDVLQKRGLLLQLHRGHRLGDGRASLSEYTLLLPSTAHPHEPLTDTSTAHRDEQPTAPSRPPRNPSTAHHTASTAHHTASTVHPDEPLPLLVSIGEGTGSPPSPSRPARRTPDSTSFRAAKVLIEQLSPESHEFLLPGLHRIALKLADRTDRSTLVHDLADTIRTRGPLTGPGIRSPLAVLLYRLDEAIEVHQSMRESFRRSLGADPEPPSPTSAVCDCAGGWRGEDHEGRPIACTRCKPRYGVRTPLF